MTDPLTDAYLDAIEQRANAATEGPWFQDSDNPGLVWGEQRSDGDGYWSLFASETGHDATAEPQDAEFIAHARGDVPALVAEVRRRMATEQRVRALHHPVPAPTSQHYHCEPYECDRAGEGELRDECGECGRWCPCPTIDALDGGE